MKTRNFLALLLLMVAGVQSVWSQSMLVWHNGEPLQLNLNRVDSVTFRDAMPREWVDFGLPSGTLWATYNVGADTPETFGEYFAWGEVEPKPSYWYSNYRYYTKKTSGYDPYSPINNYDVTKYNTKSEYGTVDNKTELEPGDDAATVNWGSEWQTPSVEQWGELFDDKFTEVITEKRSGVKGITIRKIGNPETSIFLPTAGYYDENFFNSNDWNYWSRSLDEYDNLCALSVNYAIVEESPRYYGLCVRPVCVLESPYEFLVQEIQLDETDVSVNVNDNILLLATVLPEYAKNQKLEWESSDRSVAKVSDGLVTALSEGECTITCRATDGSGVYAECKVDVNGRPYVDLCLPSGTLWATFNVGAQSPEEYGDYFAWGETKPKKNFGTWGDYSWGTYKWMNTGQADWTQINKYTFADNQTEACWYDSSGTFIGDGNTVLLPEDDAATANWGRYWQMPTVAQMSELFDSENTTSTWTTKNGVNGRLVTSIRNNASIFLPAAGRRNGTELDGNCGFYWTNMLDERYYTDHACQLYFDASSVSVVGRFDRYCGESVRPVRVKKAVRVQEITLNEEDVCIYSWKEPKTVTLVATVLPENAENKAVKWESSNTKVAVVSKDGVVSIPQTPFLSAADGECVITCSAIDGSGVKATCIVKVNHSGSAL